MTKKATISKNKYNAKAYEQIRLLVKIGEKEPIRQHAESRGESLNGFINRAIREQIKRDGQQLDQTEQEE